MYCQICGNQLGQTDCFCGFCGASVFAKENLTTAKPLTKKQEFLKSIFLLLTPVISLIWSLLYPLFRTAVLQSEGIEAYLAFGEVGRYISCIVIAIWLAALAYACVYRSRWVAVLFACLLALCSAAFLIINGVEFLRLWELRNDDTVDLERVYALTAVVIKIVDMFLPFFMMYVVFLMRKVMGKRKTLLGFVASLLTGTIYYLRTSLQMWLKYRILLSKGFFAPFAYDRAENLLYFWFFTVGTVLVYLLLFVIYRKDRKGETAKR